MSSEDNDRRISKAERVSLSIAFSAFSATFLSCA
nr:MAG TPA: hypothetical protein [Caudoviricetes sp.]